MENADQQPNEPEQPVARKGIVVPLEDIVAPIIFIIAIAVVVALLLRLGLPIWASFLVGIPTGFFGPMAIIWLLDRCYRGRR